MNTSILRSTVQWLLAVGLASDIWGSQPSPDPRSAPFSRLIVFGDSLSDMGRFYDLTGGFPPAPYFEGRFSNGRLWVEYLAEDLGMTLLPRDNYALAGATTGQVNSNEDEVGFDLPGTQDQIVAFLTDSAQEGADQDALYLLWAGANDVFEAFESGVGSEALVATGVANTVENIQMLWSAGARHIVVANLPDLSVTPFGLSSGASGMISELVDTYNSMLAKALEHLNDAGIETIPVDSAGVLRDMVNSPAQFGFTNVTQPALFTAGDSSTFVFWDYVHPTTAAHNVFASASLDRIIDHFSPARSQDTPPSRLKALKGLVRAASRSP